MNIEYEVTKMCIEGEYNERRRVLTVNFFRDFRICMSVSPPTGVWKETIGKGRESSASNVSISVSQLLADDPFLWLMMFLMMLHPEISLLD